MSTKEFEEKMKKCITSFENDLSNIRAGRANPKILDKVTVPYYGMDTPINQVANITVPEARIVQIQPFDNSIIKDIERAINAHDLGVNPSSDGKVIRLVFPEPTEDRRKELTKEVKKKGEDAKVAVRNVRRDAMDTLKKQNKANELTDDELSVKEDEIQKYTDKFVAEIDKIVEAKNKEILTV